ncbi:MAG: glycoside hydrolase [Pseudonocardiales bacterium]|nr:glycoside hydrolase [Pseudonocardiales bacterium]MBV9030896.1 glycoside hydrolase [Pseudonocardiales bacterium]
MSVWAARAAAAERAVHTRHLRRVWGLPGTRLGGISWPADWSGGRLAHWHYWWQAHLLDCTIDAYHRAPTQWRRETIAALACGVRVRNITGWVNDYYDDIAWLGLALQRGATLAGLRKPGAERAIMRRLRSGRGPSGGMRWRVGDDFVNVPATGPAAILYARRGNLGIAASLTDWVLTHLVDPDTGLVFDGARVNPDGSVRTVERAVYSYCQGVLLGACVELGTATGAPRWWRQAEATVHAVAEHLTDGGVLLGHGGGDGGLFTGILARYLALAAVALPSGEVAARLVLDSAEAAWRNRGVADGGPVFGPQWTVPAQPPGPGLAERDLSVQLSGWMLLEAAAGLSMGPS